MEPIADEAYERVFRCQRKQLVFAEGSIYAREFLQVVCDGFLDWPGLQFADGQYFFIDVHLLVDDSADKGQAHPKNGVQVRVQSPGKGIFV